MNDRPRTIVSRPTDVGVGGSACVGAAQELRRRRNVLKDPPQGKTKTEKNAVAIAENDDHVTLARPAHPIAPMSL